MCEGNHHNHATTPLRNGWFPRTPKTFNIKKKKKSLEESKRYLIQEIALPKNRASRCGSKRGR